MAIRETLKYLSNGLRIVAGILSGVLFSWAWTMSDHGEFLFALIGTVMAVVFAFVALYGWRGFLEHPPRLTKTLKVVVGIFAFTWGVIQAFVIYRNKGDKPWTNFRASDFATAHSYLSLVMLVSWKWLVVLGVGALGYAIGRFTKPETSANTKVRDGSQPQEDHVEESKLDILFEPNAPYMSWTPTGREPTRPYMAPPPPEQRIEVRIAVKNNDKDGETITHLRVAIEEITIKGETYLNVPLREMNDAAPYRQEFPLNADTPLYFRVAERISTEDVLRLFTATQTDPVEIANVDCIIVASGSKTIPRRKRLSITPVPRGGLMATLTEIA